MLSESQLRLVGRAGRGQCCVVEQQCAEGGVEAWMAEGDGGMKSQGKMSHSIVTPAQISLLHWASLKWCFWVCVCVCCVHSYWSTHIFQIHYYYTLQHFLSPWKVNCLLLKYQWLFNATVQMVNCSAFWKATELFFMARVIKCWTAPIECVMKTKLEKNNIIWDPFKTAPSVVAVQQKRCRCVQVEAL